MDDTARDERLNAAVKLAEGATEDELDALRVWAGTQSRFHAPGRSKLARFWNWALDTEYTALGPPPVFAIGVGVAFGLWGVLVFFLFVA
jgi:hypothetical protein